MDQQKKNTLNRQRPLEFKVSDYLLLEVSSNKRSYEIWQEGKTKSPICWAFVVIERIGEVVYRLALLLILSKLYDDFHVFTSKNCLRDPFDALSYESLDIDPKLV